MDNDDTNRIIEALGEFTDALKSQSSLDKSLRLIVNLTCKMLDTTQAAVLLLDEGRQLFIVQAITGIESENIRVGFPLLIPERLQKILLKIQHFSPINWVDAGLDGVNFPIITVPLYHKDTRIGLLFAGGARDTGKTTDPLRCKLFSLMAPIASLIIENARATDLINQRVLTNARHQMESVLKEDNPSGGNSSEHLVTTSIRNPSKVVKLLTEAYYRELAAAGFDDSQITIAASHLIDCIIHRGNPPKEA